MPSAQSRQRRDLATGRAAPETAMIRYVVGPGGVITPDLGRKLPGRGLWLAASAEATALAVRRGLFARAAKAAVTAPGDLADQVVIGLQRRLLAGLGLARKAGWLAAGYEKTLAAVEGGRAAFLIEALDGARDGRRRLSAAAARLAAPPRLIGLFTVDELSLALGRETVIHAAFLAGRGADRWALDAERLSGFRPLFPESWREETPGRGEERRADTHRLAREETAPSRSHADDGAPS